MVSVLISGIVIYSCSQKSQTESESDEKPYMVFNGSNPYIHSIIVLCDSGTSAVIVLSGLRFSFQCVLIWNVV